MRRRLKKNVENFNIEQYVDKELEDKFTLWALRIIVRLNGINEFIDKYGEFRRNEIAYFLGLGEYVDTKEELNKKNILQQLKEKQIQFEKRKRFTTSKILNRNIKKISALMDLNPYEEQILEFTILLNQYDILDDITDLLGNKLNINHVKKYLSVILNIPYTEIDNAFKSNSKFLKSSLISFYKKGTNSLKSKIDLISDEFAENMLSSNEDIEYMIKDIISKCDYTDLTLNDFGYLHKELSVIIPYLKDAMENNLKGVNVLFYGSPGTGKTELVKAIANELQRELYEISYSDEDDEPIEGKKRLEAYKGAQALLTKKNVLLLFDEVEDVLNNSSSSRQLRQQNKAWINRAIENNIIPTIWITNNVHCIDSAIIRRFDVSIEIPIPSKSKREKILQKYSANQLSTEAISKLALNETIAPALVSRALKVVSSLKDLENKDDAFEMIVHNTLKAQGYDGVKDNSSISLPKTYNPAYINSDVNLDKLTNGIKESQNARVCLYGPAGTGKSAYGKYLAQVLDKPLLLKKGSDLISMWVGETEKNIAQAFKEAKEENAVLVFDEVDSFLSDRKSATKNWEITQVNEMLVQMESFDGIFIATTNLMDNLDKASLRRFDLKLEFSFLKPEQAWELFNKECENIGLDVISKTHRKCVESLSLLTPGDFAAVLRQNRFNPIINASDFYERLKNEVIVKNIGNSKKMGFM